MKYHAAADGDCGDGDDDQPFSIYLFQIKSKELN